jgi:hypothetical protein
LISGERRFCSERQAASRYVARFGSVIHGASLCEKGDLIPLARQIPREGPKIRKISEINPPASGTARQGPDTIRAIRAIQFSSILTWPAAQLGSRRDSEQGGFSADDLGSGDVRKSLPLCHTGKQSRDPAALERRFRYAFWNRGL